MSSGLQHHDTDEPGQRLFGGTLFELLLCDGQACRVSEVAFRAHLQLAKSQSVNIRLAHCKVAHLE